jgi:hypothetical protein
VTLLAAGISDSRPGNRPQQIEIEHKKEIKKENQTGQLSRGPKIDRMGHLMRPLPVDPFID